MDPKKFFHQGAARDFRSELEIDALAPVLPQV